MNCKLRYLVATAAVALLSWSASAENLTIKLTSAGSLSKLTKDSELATLDSLTIQGPVNIKDLHTAWRACFNGNLRYLNLADAQFENNRIPDYAFFIPSEQFAKDNHFLPMDEIVLPDNIVEIGKNAFAYTYLTKMNIPSSLRKLNIGSFKMSNIGCERRAENLVFPEGIEEIPDSCFVGTLAGETFTIPSTVRRIGDVAFYRTAIYNVKFPESLEEIGFRAFYETGTKTLILPDNCHTIGTLAFGSSDYISKIILPKNLKAVPDGFAPHCHITEIEVPASVTRIGESAFSICHDLKNVILHDGLEIIAADALSGCEKLSKLVLPSTLTKIEKYALSDIYTIYCRATTPPVCEENATNARFLYIPIGTKELYQASPVWSKVKNIVEIDDAAFTAAINDIEPDSNNSFSISAENGCLQITTNAAEAFTVYNLNGQPVANGIANPSASISLPSGIYIVTIANESVKIAL